MQTVRLAIIDSHPIFREGLTSILDKVSDIEVIGTTSTAKEMFAQFKKNASNMLLMDINFTKESNLEIVPDFKEKYPDLKIIGLSNYEQPNFIQNAIDKGCNGYIAKDSTEAKLIQGIHQVSKGELYVSNELYIPVQDGKIDYDKSLYYRTRFLEKTKLTRREVDIISFIAQSFSNKEIADFLYISEYTVKAHRRNLKAKLHLSNTADITRFAIKTGITRPWSFWYFLSKYLTKHTIVFHAKIVTCDYFMSL